MREVAQRAAAEYDDVPLVDVAEQCAITWENYSGYMMDKIHPTTAGMKLISDCIEAELVAYYTENRPHTHTYTSIITAPTCTKYGYTTYTCACGDGYVDDYVDATGHAYESGICTGCGAMLGDLNCDGLVNSDDLTLLARHVARIESVTGTALANADVNGDGVVTSDDLTKLARYVARIITDWDQA